MKHPKKPVGLAVGLAPKKGVLESGVFPTFLQNLFCLLMTLKLSFDMTPCKQDSRNSILIMQIKCRRCEYVTRIDGVSYSLPSSQSTDTFRISASAFNSISDTGRF